MESESDGQPAGTENNLQNTFTLINYKLGIKVSQNRFSLFVRLRRRQARRSPSFPQAPAASHPAGLHAWTAVRGGKLTTCQVGTSFSKSLLCKLTFTAEVQMLAKCHEDVQVLKLEVIGGIFQRRPRRRR